MYAVKEYNKTKEFQGYTTTSPMSKDEAIKNANQHRQWAKEDGSGYTYRICKVHLVSA